jgi:hypothetical protein
MSLFKFTSPYSFLSKYWRSLFQFVFRQQKTISNIEKPKLILDVVYPHKDEFNNETLTIVKKRIIIKNKNKKQQITDIPSLCQYERDIDKLLTHFNNNNNKKTEKIVKMCFIGQQLQNIKQDGWKISEFTDLYIEYFGETNIWKKNNLDREKRYDYKAGVRSLLYELSPSSSQYWFKYGNYKNDFNMILFVNVELAKLNHSYEWGVSGKTKGRSGNNGKWMYIGQLNICNFILKQNLFIKILY